MAKPLPESVVFVLERFSRWGDVQAKYMFGGYALSLEGRTFTLIDDDQLFLKINEATKDQFAAAGSRQFEVEMSGKMMPMAYMTFPAALEDPVETWKEWVDLALSVAVAPKPKRRKT
jgi:DNA transformation protein and related proteins